MCDNERAKRTRFTVRVQGENVRMNDWYVVGFTTDRTVCAVGMVGQVCRIRCYDETDGEMLPMPEFWFVDRRTEHIVGPVRRDEIDIIKAIDGPFITDQEGKEVAGDEYTSGIDCGPESTWVRD